MAASDVPIAGDSAGVPDRLAGVQPFNLKRVTVRGGTGTFEVRGSIDTTVLGSYVGLADALRKGFTFQLAGAGLPLPQTIHFPPCVSVIICEGSASEVASFVRKGTSNRFDVTITGYEPFNGPFVPLGVLTTLSLGDEDFVGLSAHCRARGRGQQNVTCRP